VSGGHDEEQVKARHGSETSWGGYTLPYIFTQMPQLSTGNMSNNRGEQAVSSCTVSEAAAAILFRLC
jgi:hypothetical protein